MPLRFKTEAEFDRWQRSLPPRPTLVVSNKIPPVTARAPEPGGLPERPRRQRRCLAHVRRNAVAYAYVAWVAWALAALVVAYHHWMVY